MDGHVFPLQVIGNILSRLPVKSLIRFKCVSKTWHKLISHPTFQGIQRQRSHLRLVFRSSTTVDPFTYRFTCVDYNGNGSSATSTFTAKVDNPILFMLPTSCCGLICFATDTPRIYLANPATHDILALPLLPRTNPISIPAFGFGSGSGSLPSVSVSLQPTTFKVICLTDRVSRPSLPPQMDCYTLTFRLGEEEKSNNKGGGLGLGLQFQLQWRVLNHNCFFSVEPFSFPAFANQSIYWKINRRRLPTNSRSLLISFNINTDKLQIINQPSDFQHTAHNSIHLTALCGKLLLVDVFTSHVLLWNLEDHHNSIWFKQFFIDLRQIGRSIFGEVKAFVDREIIFSSPLNCIFYYHVKDRKFRTTSLSFPASDFTFYWETLYPLQS